MALVLKNDQGAFLLEKNETNGLLSGFWSFPLLEASDALDDITIRQLFESHYPCQIALTERTFTPVTHTFSHQKWTITLREAQLIQEIAPLPDHLAWIAPQDFATLPMATPQKKMLAAYTADSQVD